MQLYILLRGHEGAGKSTFAAHQIARFRSAHPRATIVHLDNDLAMLDENGMYHFDFKKFTIAHQANQARQLAALKWGQRAPQRDILIINANPNQKAKACEKQLALAKAHGFQTLCYRLHYFFDNLHAVSPEEVQQSYARLNANPVAGEIHLPPLFQAA